MCVVGLTGGIACGKSSVCELLKSNGFSIIDSDMISHQIMTNDQGLIKEVKKHFPSVVSSEGVVDRVALGKIIFEDSKKRKLLNKMTHSRIFKEIFR